MDTLLTSPDRFKEIANVLYIYGPFALVFLFMFVAEWRIKPSLKESAGQVKKVSLGMYIGVWIVAVCCAGICVFAWLKLNLHHEYVIRGTFENVNGSETVTSDHASLWLQRTYGGHDGSYNYAWRLISDKPIKKGQLIDFYLNRISKTSNMQEALKISLLARPDFYRIQPVRIKFDRRTDSAFLLLDEKRESLSAELYAAIPPFAVPFHLSNRETVVDLFLNCLVPSAYAAKKQTPPLRMEELASPDPIIRMNARQSAFNAKDEGVERMLSALNDPETPPQVRSAILLFLADAPALASTPLTPEQKSLLIDECASNSPPDRTNAVKIIANLPNGDFNGLIIESICREKRKPNPDPNRLSGFARARMNLLYNQAIRETELYSRGKPDDKQRVVKAFDLFEEAFNLNKSAVPDEKVFFAMPLYGWALAAHERSWIDRPPDGGRKPEYIRAAQDRFRGFLEYLETVPNAKEYPHSDHLLKARAYIEHPEPKSLESMGR